MLVKEIMVSHSIVDDIDNSDLYEKRIEEIWEDFELFSKD